MATCFLCGERMVPRFSARDHLRPEVLVEYQVAWCRTCEYGRVEGDFTPDDVAAFYSADYYTHSAPGAIGGSPMGIADRLRMHLAWRADRGIDLSPDELTRTKAHPTMCDVGCGAGQIMSRFKQAGYEAVGIEPDCAARKVASKIGEVFAGAAEELPCEIEGRHFDVTLLSHVLEHCIDPVAALRNLKGLLAPGGSAIIEVPNNAALGFEAFGPAWFFADVPRHLHFFTANSLRETLGRVGLRVTRTIYTGYTRQFSPEWLAAQEQIRARVLRNRNGAGNENSWGLLAQTAFARASRKYDSVRAHAVHG